MVPLCPLCHRVIPGDDYNVAKDLAFCRACNESYSFADLTRTAELEATITVQRPPRGTWYRQKGSDVIFGGSLSSLPLALGCLLIALFWNGIVSIFVCSALSGTLHLLGVATPSWFFEPKVNGHIMRRGDVIGIWLFLIPFILVGFGMLCALGMRIAGKVEVRVGRGEGAIFTGMGPIGWRRKFDPRQVEAVRVVEPRSGDEATRSCVELSFRGDKRPMKFGSMLWGDRQKFVAGALSRHIRDGAGSLNERR